MTLTTEAIIALIALFVACVPGIRFLISHKSVICQWWSRDRSPADLETSQPSSAPPVNNHTPFFNASDYPPNNANQLDPIHFLMQRFQNLSRRTLSQRLEAGIFFYTQTTTNHLEEIEPFAGGANGGDVLPVIEQHRQP